MLPYVGSGDYCYANSLYMSLLASCPIWGLSTRLLCFVSLDPFQRESVASIQ